MKKYIDIILDKAPYAILVLLIFPIAVYIYSNGFHYEQIIGFIEALIWPSIVLCALLFFRKVFTYLFFSMEEFNFFGNKGSLKNVQDLIDEKVNQRFEKESREKERQESFEKIELELEKANASREDVEKQNDVNHRLATKLFQDYKKIFEDHNKTIEELSIYRKREEAKEMRRSAFRDRMKQNRLNQYLSSSETGLIGGNDETLEKEEVEKERMDEVMVDNVKQLLPSQPWPKGIGSEISKKLNITRREVDEAIKILIDKGFFKFQMNGKLYVPEETINNRPSQE